MTDNQCARCGEVNPAEIHTCTPKQEEGCAECGKQASEGWALYCVKCSEPVREWQGLTDEEERQCRANANASHYRHVRSIRGQHLSPADDWEWHFIRAIEAKLKEKNGGCHK